MARLLRRGLLAVFAAAIVLAGMALGYRAWRQHENALAFAIHTPNGIAEASFVRIGGIDQWLQIRGEDRSNPVLLVLAGGPGDSLIPFTPIFRGWEKYFTVVQWDQRGTGRTFRRNGEVGEEPLTIARMTQDGIEVAQYLRGHLHKKRIVVLGYSWGTILGVRMVKLRPELFSAYVGTGQVVSKAEKETFLHDTLMKRLRADRDGQAVAALERLGPPPYRSEADLLVERRLFSRYDVASERTLERAMAPVVIFAPDFSLIDIYDMLRSPKVTGERLYREALSYDARKLGPKFDVPFFIFNGEKDNVTPTVLARRYFDWVQAPKKGFVVLKGGGHSALLTMPDAILRELVRQVRPLAVE